MTLKEKMNNNNIDEKSVDTNEKINGDQNQSDKDKPQVGLIRKSSL